MAGNVQVVLREDVKNLGSTGDVVHVKPGYARNYLLPRGLAVAATRGNVEQIEHERRVARERAARLRKDAEGVASALAEITVEVVKQAGEGGKLYGSVTSADIAAELKEKGYELDKRKIEMPAQAIKEVGSYEVSAKLAPGVAPTIKVEVSAAS